MNRLIRLIQKTYRMVDPQEGKRILQNVASLSGLQAITYVFPILIMPFLFRTLGAEKFGLISFAQAFVQYFMIMTDYGFNVSATKEISLHQDNEKKIHQIYSAVMTIKIVMAAASLLILCVIIFFFPKFLKDWLIYILSFGAVIGSTFFPVWYFQGTERMKYIAKLNIIGEFIYAIGIFALIRKPQDYLMVPVITSSVALIVGIWGQVILFNQFKIRFRVPSLKEIQVQLQAGWNIFISVVAINAYTNTRIFAVGLLTNNTLTGFYSIADKIANAAQTFPLSAFSQAIFPRLSKIYQKNKIKAFDIMKQVQLVTLIISLIFLPIIFFLSPLIIKLVCGAYYPAAILTLKFLLVSVFFISSNAFRVQFLLVCGKTDTYSKIHITMAVIGLPLIIVMISKFSYAGAAMATALIEAGVFIITYFTVKKLVLA